MLEIRGLKKVYKAKKGGAQVRALDGVSIRFPEKGMVFLLGKSGSGKSTLLNLCGGLDAPDEGEIVIKGRSSKDFTQSDFDSYRNTFVGFVFQEYNILNEFSVEDNIALALELQGKGRDRAQVKAILAQVDLLDFAKRKPNTLSGGQKQRVAIARALVKNPEILLADEPTGALDSNTGKQVFDTLKKLSADKLVIVVSHDREFAEIYGDRIIELKDGKVVSDVTKEKIAATRAGDNLTFIGEDTIAVQDGSRLTDADMGRIRDFLTRSKGKVLLSCGQKEIDGFRKAARIDEDGGREAFEATDEASIPQKAYTEADSKFIRSKLPFRHALHIGASNLRVKPFRLIFTILLSFIAFTMFGLFSTLTFYDPIATAARTYRNNSYETLQLQKHYFYEQIDVSSDGDRETLYRGTGDTLLTPADVAAISDEYGGAHPWFNFSYNGNVEFSIENSGYPNGTGSDYYQHTLRGYAEAAGGEWDLLTDTDLSALGSDEIVISSYTFESLQQAGLYEYTEETEESGEIIPLDDYEDIVGEKLLVYSQHNGTATPLTVRGVYESRPSAKFDPLKEGASFQDPTEYNALRNEFIRDRNCGLYTLALVSDDFYDAQKDRFGSAGRDMTDYGFIPLFSDLLVHDSPHGQDYFANVFSVNSLPPRQGAAPAQIAFFDGRTDNTLRKGEIVLSYEAILGQMFDLINAERDRLIREADKLQNAGDEAAAEQAYAAADAWAQKASNEYNIILQGGNYTVIDEDTGVYHEEPATEAQKREAVQNILALIEQYADAEDPILRRELTLTSAAAPDISAGTYTLAGFFYAEMSSSNAQSAYVSEQDMDALIQSSAPSDIAYSYTVTESKYVRPADAVYNGVIFRTPASESALYSLLRRQAETVNEDDDTFFSVQTSVSDQLEMINNMVEMLGTIFLWVGVAMAVFAMLLLFNFISVSITYKKREIGILRAVGARSADVFKIFYSESAIITLLCYALAMIASFFGCGILNAELADFTNVALFVFGPVSWLVMLGIALATSVAATFLPVYGIAKRRPVESIRAL